MIPEYTKKKLVTFIKIKRSSISLAVLLVIYILSLFSEFIANDKPLLIRYNSKNYWLSAFILYSDKEFGGQYDTEAQYRRLIDTDRFIKDKNNFIIFPPIPYGPNYIDLIELEGFPPTAPSSEHILGTDNKGRDIFARILYGYRISITFALILLIVEILLGVIIGSIQGYLGGKVDLSIQRLIEILSSLPFLYIVILFSKVFGRSFTTLLVIMSIFNWIGLSYYMRSEYLKLKQLQFVEAARSVGAGNIYIMYSEILPNALVPVITFAPFSIIASISSLSALDYLGFGLPPHIPTWGELISQGMSNLSKYWLSVYPLAVLFGTLLLTAFVGEGVRNILDPKRYTRVE